MVAIGKAGFVTAEDVREGAPWSSTWASTRSKTQSTERGYRLVGDVDYAGVAPKTAAITPVPGGVGPMTIAMLMANTVKACKLAA